MAHREGLRSQSSTQDNSNMEDDEFLLRFQSALKDPTSAQYFRDIMRPLFDETKGAQNDMNKVLLDLKQQITVKDAEISTLKSKVTVLENQVDDMEQWQRRGSARIQGLKDSPSESNDSLDQKIIDISKAIKVEPPLTVADIEVAHRLPHPKALLQKLAQEAADERGVALGTLPDGSQTTDLMKLIPPEKLPPRSVIVKFASRRVKARVMAVRRKLKTELKDKNAYPTPVYLQDDLTAKRAKLAYLGRKLAQQGKIQESWVFDSKVLIKDSNSRVRPIRCIKDLAMFGIRDDT